MTRLIDADALKKIIHCEYSDDLGILDKIDNAPTVPLPDFKEGCKQAIIDGKTNFSRPQGEQKDIDIPKMCEECHSQSYNNGFDAGYELGKKDAQKHITELNERIEFLMQQIRLWQSSEQQVHPESDCVENMDEQETFIDEERHQDEWTTRRYEGDKE